MSTTRKILSTPIILSQFFALMPLSGIRKGELKFRWCSLKIIYCTIYLILNMLNTCFFLAMVSLNGIITFVNIVTLLFYTCSLVTAGFFIKLAQEWPDVMKRWKEIDEIMKTAYGISDEIKRKVQIITTMVVGAAALEHALCIAFALSENSRYIGSVTDVNRYFKATFGHIFEFLPYSFYLGFIFEMVNIFSTFSWNYMDLFIIVISAILADRFKQVKERIIDAANNKVLDIYIWMEIREHYNMLNLLTKLLDEALSNIILLSFANNLFIILVQLLHSLEPSGTTIIERTYFAYSFGFLILRTMAVSIFTADIYVESTEPANALNELPSEIYNEEIDRLLLQIKMDPSYFSGKRFFKITKSLILSIAGAIVSYELIFIQFVIH